MTNSNTVINPITVILTGACMISFSAVWVTLADVPPMASAFYRVFFGALFLGLTMLITGEKLKQIKDNIVPSIVCGIFFGLDLYFWHTSIGYIGPGLSTIISNFQVFLMAICGALFFKERLSFRFVFSMPLAIGGLFLIIGVNWAELPDDYRAGIYYGLLTALVYALFMLTLRTIKTEDGSRFGPLFIISAITAAFLGTVMVMSDVSFAIPSIKSGVSLVCLGLMSQMVGWFFISWAIPQLPPSVTGLALLLQPALSFIWDVLFFSRPTSTLNWLGASIAIWAIYLGLTGSNRSQSR